MFGSIRWKSTIILKIEKAIIMIIINKETMDPGRVLKDSSPLYVKFIY